MLRLQFSICTICLLKSIFPNHVLAQEPSIQVQLPAGFAIERAANDNLATNIYRLGLNPRGELFVSGPGYIRQLIDSNQDGVFDQSKQFSDGPASGAQGLYCADDFVLAVGDDGVWKYEDRDRDGIADNKPELKFKIGTGGEHFAHQVRLGPDGWYYLLAGNQTPIVPKFSSGPTSPIEFPRAGYLMRFSTDFQNFEVVAHGFRNAYDFTFNDRDQIFVYDSDDEREAGLPWYRPTRLFQVQPGDDAGWLNDGWKRPGYFFDMPKELGAVGRGSPTGVLCYQSNAFPPDYDQAIFFADWTFGRIFVAKRDPTTLQYLPPEPFAAAKNNFGFAITDMLIDSEGRLLVSVGGRGTAGAIYRIKFNGPAEERARKSINLSELHLIARKRSAWNNEDWRLVLSGLSPNSDQPKASVSEVRRLALASMVGRAFELERLKSLHPQLIEGLQASLIEFDPEITKLTLRIGLELDPKILAQIVRSKLPLANRMLLSHLIDELGDRRLDLTKEILSEITSSLQNSAPLSQSELLACCRVSQIALGDFGESRSDLAFCGYTLNQQVKVGTELSGELGEQFAKAIALAADRSYSDLSRELGRVSALLDLNSANLQKAMLAQITAESSPIEDVHWLFCLSRTGSINSLNEQQALIEILGSLRAKFDSIRIPTDRNWETRIQAMFHALIKQTSPLADQLVARFTGEESQMFWVACFPEKQQSIAVDRLARRVSKSIPETKLKQLQVLFANRSSEHQQLFRKTAELPHLQEISILALTRLPVEQDRSWYRQGLLSRNLTLVKQSAIALRKLTNKANPSDLIQAYVAATRLNWSDQHTLVRDQLLMLISTAVTLPENLPEFQFKRPNLDQSSFMTGLGDWLKKQYPAESAELLATPSDWQKVFQQADWAAGDFARGKQLFESLKCAQCHQSNSALGPSLEGITQRYSRSDTFRVVGEPSQRISDRYRAKLIVTTDGDTVFGLPIYESVDGITLQDTSGQTIRIEADSIEETRDSDQSLMPNGLLDGLSPGQFADLYAYLESLK